METKLLTELKQNCFSFKKPKGSKESNQDIDIDKPFDYAGKHFKNRFVFSNLTDECFFEKGILKNKDEIVSYYENISNSGVGFIITGGVSAIGKQNSAIKYDNVFNLNVFSDLTRKIHTYGCNICFKIKSNFGRVNCVDKFVGILPYSASFNHNYADSRVKCMRISDQKSVYMCDEMVELARFAKMSGFDAVLVDGTIDGLIGEMSSAEFNNRVFGCFSEIRELSTLIVKKVSKELKGLTVLFKINISTFLNLFFGEDLTDINTLKNVKSFTNIDDKLDLMKDLVDAGVDGFVVEFGCAELDFLRNKLPYQSKDLFKNIIDKLIDYLNAHKIKNKHGENVIIIGNDDFDYNSQFSPYEFVDITKKVLANNNYLNNKKVQKYNNFCIKCNKCIDLANKFCINKCAVNPLLNSKLKTANNKNKDKIAVIGAGVSGLISALTLASRGYIVDLFDKNESANLNGILYEVYGFDTSLQQFNNYLKSKLENFIKNGKINAVFKTRCEFNAIFYKQYKSVVIATGSNEKIFGVVGAVQKHVKSIYDVLKSKKIFESKSNITIYVKSELGLKLALYLSVSHFNVNIIFKDVGFMFNLPDANLSYYLIALKDSGAVVYFVSQIKRIHEDSVDIIINNRLVKKNFVDIILNMKSKSYYKFAPLLKTIDADLFVYEPELVANNKLFYDFVRNGYQGELFIVGDALNISGLSGAVETGFYVGNNI